MIDLLGIPCVVVIELGEVLRQGLRIVHPRETQAASRRVVLASLLSVLANVPRPQRLQSLRLSARVHRQSIRHGPIDDHHDMVVVLGEVIEQHGIGGAAIGIRDGRSLERHGTDVGLAVGKVQEPLAALYGTLDIRPVRIHVAQELREFASLEDQFAQSFMADSSLSVPELTWQVSVETDQHEVVGCGHDVFGAEVAGVEANHAAEVDLGLLLCGHSDYTLLACPQCSMATIDVRSSDTEPAKSDTLRSP